MAETHEDERTTGPNEQAISGSGEHGATGPRGDGAEAADAERRILPLMPLTTGVVFPNMVVTLALETDEAKAAAEAPASKAS